MARPRILVLSSPRLARLDGLLVASGAHPSRIERVDDAMELFEVDAATGALLIADLKDVPFADAGLLRRWQERTPGSAILWIGGDGRSEAAFLDAGIRGTRLPWPIDVEALEELARGEVPRNAQAKAEASRDHGDAAAPAEPREAKRSRAASSGANSAPEDHEPQGPDDGPDMELNEIESILGQGHTTELAGAPATAASHGATTAPQGFDGVVAAEVMSDEAAADRHSPSPKPRSAFLRAPTSQAERPIPVPASTLRGSADAHGEPGLADAELEEAATPIESSLADVHSLDEPLLTGEEIEAFFGDSDDFVIPAMEPAGREGPVEDASTSRPGESEVETLVDSDAAGDPPLDGSNGAAAPASPSAPGETEDDASATDSRRPAWLKDQVADLADIVQALDLTARSTHAHLGLERELGQLRQFTRTIGYVAAPPPRGEQAFDLAVLLEEQLGALAGQSPDAPRILFRSRVDGALIEADKLLVTMALEALLLTAVGCAGPGDVIRVSIDAGDEGAPCIHIRFPAGPMADLSPADALQPYALKARLPDIGANALAAAGAIAVGQGGDLVLRGEDGGHRVFDVSFSGAPRV